MSKQQDGGPAFPRHVALVVNGKINFDVLPDSGLTVRDWFAGQALDPLIHLASENDTGLLALDAYKMADAMLAEREKLGMETLKCD